MPLTVTATADPELLRVMPVATMPVWLSDKVSAAVVLAVTSNEPAQAFPALPSPDSRQEPATMGGRHKPRTNVENDLPPDARHTQTVRNILSAQCVTTTLGVYTTRWTTFFANVSWN